MKKNNAEPTPASGKVEANWSSSAQYASWQNGGYTVYNNIWGSGAGSQSIWANFYSNWGIWANHPNTGGIKSYPNSTKYVGVALSNLNSCSSSFNVTTPSSRAWVVAYDIWDNNNHYETMLWMNSTCNTDGSGNVKPISYNWNAAGNPRYLCIPINPSEATPGMFSGVTMEAMMFFRF